MVVCLLYGIRMHLTYKTSLNLLLAATLQLNSCAISAPVSEGKPVHHGERGFVNPHSGPLEKSFFGYLSEKFFGDTEWADHEELASTVPVVSNNTDYQATEQDYSALWLGHSTFLLELNGHTILTDPIFSDRASPVSFAGPKRYVPHPIDYQTLPEIDSVVISHDHYDHLDEATVAMLGNNSHYYVPLGLKGWFLEQGISAENVTELDWWQSSDKQKVRFTALPSQHWSGRGLFNRNATLWASWLIETPEKRVWFAGDTGYNPHDFKEIGEKIDDIDLALIPIGAYSPRHFMKVHHVNPQEAVQIHQDVGARLSVGMHWGTFPLTAEAPAEPASLLLKETEKLGLTKQFISLAIGESLDF